MIANKTILIDVDSVLLKWRKGFRTYMEHQGHEWIDTDSEYYLVSKHYDLLHDDVVEHMMIFNNGHWEFGTLEPVTGSQEAIKELTNMGFRFVAISSCSTNPTAIALRKANLYNVFGDIFDAVHCVEVHTSKETHLASYEPAFWIEDNFKNCIDGIKYGHKCILLEYPWNMDDTSFEITVCHDWKNIVRHIKKEINWDDNIVHYKKK